MIRFLERIGSFVYYLIRIVHRMIIKSFRSYKAL